MKIHAVVMALLCAVYSTNAFAVQKPLETLFAGYPSGSSQHGLRELEPTLFAKQNLDRETGCLAAALYFEARGESREGQIAVAQVIMNRKEATAYPDTICGVVWQNAHKRNRCQFSFTCDGLPDVVKEKDVWQDAKMLALGMTCQIKCNYMSKVGRPSDMLDEGTRRSTHYHADYVNPGWSRKLRRMAQIGRHIFYVSPRVEKTMKRKA